MNEEEAKNTQDKPILWIRKVQDWTDRYLVPKNLAKPQPYVVSLLVVSFSLVLTSKIHILHETPTLVSLTAVVFSAWYGGLGPSLFATFLSVIGLDYFVFDPLDQINLSLRDLPPLLAFFIVGVLASSLVSSLRRSEEILERVALQDHLTGLPNRKLFEDRLDTAIAFAARNQIKLAVVFLDIDNFKEINDKWGHEVGDSCLRNVAKTLKDSIRQEDTLARWGGDEFVLILPGFSAREDIDTIMQKLFTSIKGCTKNNGQEIFVGVSCGVSIYPDIARDSSTLLRTADEALYHAKRSGKNQYQIYAPKDGMVTHGFLNR